MSSRPGPNSTLRNTHIQHLGGIRFYGDAQALRRTARALDQAAQALWTAQTRRFPSGMGRARQAIVQRMRTHFGGGITEHAATQWLQAQNWREF